MAAPVRRQIRPVQVIPFEDVEDQLWPINLLVVVLAGFVVGLILGLSRFDDPRLFYNGYFQLFTVGLTLGVWFAAIRWVRGRFKQRLKIATLFSLVAHLWLLLSLGVGYYRFLVQEKPIRDTVEEIAELRVPDYPESVMERGEVPSEYHRPVEVPLPVPQMPQTPNQPEKAPILPLEKSSVVYAQRPEPQPIPPIPVERRELTPPHRGESLAEPIRRQITEVRQEPIPPVPSPEIRPGASPKGPKEPGELVQRQPLQPPQPERTPPAAPVVLRPASGGAATLRRELPNPVQAPMPEAITPNRSVGPSPEVVARAEPPVPPRASVSQQLASVYQPRPLAIDRLQNLPVDRKGEAPAPPPLPGPSAPSAITNRRLEQPPQIPQSTQQLPARQVPLALRATVPEEPLPQMAPGQEVSRPIEPTPTLLARHQPTITDQGVDRGTSQLSGPNSAALGVVGVAVARGKTTPLAEGGLVAARPPEPATARSPHQPQFDATAEQVHLSVGPVAGSAPSALPVAQVDQLGQADMLRFQPSHPLGALPEHRPNPALSGPLPSTSGAGGSHVARGVPRGEASRPGEEGPVVPMETVGLLRARQTAPPTPSGLIPGEESSLAAVKGRETSGAGQLSQWENAAQISLTRQAAPVLMGQGHQEPTAGKLPMAFGPAGPAISRTKPAEGRMGAMDFGQPAPLPRSSSQESRLLGLSGQVPAETGPAPGSLARLGAGTAEAASGEAVQALEPGMVLIGRTQTGPGLPGTRPAGEVSSPLPGKGTGGGIETLRKGAIGWERNLSAFPDRGVPGPARQMGRLPTEDLAGKVAETGTSSGGEGISPKISSSEGESPLPSLEPVVPETDRRAGGSVAEVISDRPGAMGLSGTEKAGGIGRNLEVAQATGIGTALAKLHPRQSGEAEPEGGLPGMLLPRSVRSGLLDLATEAMPSSGTSGDQVGNWTKNVSGPSAVGIGGQAGSSHGQVGNLAGQSVEVGRQATGLPVHVVARPGVGGLSQVPSPSAGIPSRRAHLQSPEVHLAPGRFLLERSGARLAIDARAEPAEAFRQRHPSQRAQQAQQYGGSEASEQAVERGLAFLAKLQWPDGRWRLHTIPKELEIWPGQAQARQQPELLLPMAKTLLQEPNRWEQVPEIKRRYQNLHQLLQRHSEGKLDEAGLAELGELVREMVFFPGGKQSDSAATGLALLAFLGAGYTHQEGPYRTQVEAGLQWLLANQKPDGDLWGYTQGSANTWLYSHAIAAIALCEAYGMTRDAGLRQPAERAIGFIVASQHPSRGGWRYQPREDSDTSVSGWMLMALKSAQMAGLQVPQSSLDLVSRWLDLAKAPGSDGARYVYNPFSQETGPDFWFHREPTASMTAEALLMRMYLGWNREHPLLQRGADFLQANSPEPGTPERPTRDAYYWYYATQVMFQMAGSHWKSWNSKLRAYLESSQVQEGPLAGSWDPVRPVPDRFAHEGGRLYVTAMHLLMLEVYYRHLPLFKSLRDQTGP